MSDRKPGTWRAGAGVTVPLSSGSPRRSLSKPGVGLPQLGAGDGAGFAVDAPSGNPLAEASLPLPSKDGNGTHTRTSFLGEYGLAQRHKKNGAKRKLETRMKRATGQTPQTAIYRARIEQARKLLVNSHETMGEIARACGFERQERFNVVFKRLTGTTPGQYRQRSTKH